VGPQPKIIEVRNAGKRVVATTVGITGEVAELFQLPEDGEAGSGTEHLLELRKASDLMVAQVLAKHGGVEGGGSHNVIVPTETLLQ
jgi:hypothetical protein